MIAERFKFHRRNQGEGEGIAKYMAELRKLADRCQFGGYLEEALRDRLVCGLRDEAIQRKLLTMDALTLSRAYEITHGMETAQRQASELQASTKVAIVYTGRIKGPPKTRRPPRVIAAVRVITLLRFAATGVRNTITARRSVT